MPDLTLYRQARADGGVRTGLSIDGVTVAQSFEEGNAEHDPRLVWFVDVRCRGRSLPSEAGDLIDWLSAQSTPIVAALQALADSLSVGVDSDYVPGEWPIRSLPKGVVGRVVYSSIRIVDARGMAKNVHSVAKAWPAILDQLRPERAVR